MKFSSYFANTQTSPLMKRNLLFIAFLLASFAIPDLLIAQCSDGPPTCSGASPSCVPITGQLDDVPPAGALFPGCPGNSLDNPDWYAFEVNSTGLVTVTFIPSNCQGSGSGGALGAQYGWYADCDPNSQNYGVQCACTTGSGTFSATVSAGIYYLMVDGCAADVCDYTINVSGDVGGPPVTQPNTPIVNPPDPCPGEMVQICTSPVPNANTYTWSFPSGVQPVGSPPFCECVDVIWGSNSGAVSVTVANDCSTPQTSDPTVVDVPTYEVTDGGEYCFPDEPGWFHPGTNIYWPGGTHTLNLITSRGCDSIVTINVIERISPPHQAFEQICLGDFTCPIGGQSFGSPTNTTIILDNASAFGCDSTINVTVEVIAPILNLDFPDTLNCENLATGGVLVQANGQNNATYTWWTYDGLICDQITDKLIFACSPGWYHVQIIIEGIEGTDCGYAPICIMEDSIEVFANIDNPVLAMDSTNVSCGGEMDGAASVSISSGGSAPFTYNWNGPGGSTSSIDNLPAGTYTVTVTGGNGCSAIDSVTITEPVPVELALVGTTDASCNGGMDGSATVVASGGTPNYTYTWPGGQNAPTATNLASGTYLVSTTDANGCTQTLSVVVSEPSTMAITPSSTDASCNGGTDGSASVSTAGGTPPYTYAWSHDPTNTTPMATNLSATDYSVTITDDSGCREIVSFTIDEPSPVSATASVMDATCNGIPDGSATISASGGTPNYSYAWPGGQTTATVSSLAPGMYTVVVSDDNGCTDEVVVMIDEPAAIVLSEVATQDVSCNGESDGQASVSASGGTSPFSYSWSSGQVGPNPNDLSAGTHTVVVTDGNGCTEELMVTINEPSVLNLIEDASTDATCFGLNNGTATVNGSGGVSPYSYSWSGGQIGGTVNDLAAGNHTVVVTDANGCTEQIVIAIMQPPVLTLVEISTTDASCNQVADGSATVDGNGGTAPYSYDWPGGQSGATVNNLAAGDYDVTVTDANGCTNELSLTIDEPTDLALAEVDSEDAFCNGDSNGSATVAGSGGTSPYAYDWSTGNTGASATNLPAGTHTVTVTDDNGCTEEISITINEPPVLTISEEEVTNALCDGSTDGTATVSAGGGTAPYDFEWSTGQTGATADNLAAGTYTVTVTDDNGCTEELSILVDNPPALVMNEESTNDVRCNGDSNGGASVSTTGGTAPYSYDWSNGENGSSVNNLTAGTHTVTVTDDNGCTEEISVLINEPPLLTLTEDAITDALCNGASDGTATVSGAGGTAPYSYDWSNGLTGNNVNNLPAGTHSVTITDANGCTETIDITIDEPEEVTLAETDNADASCNGSSDGSSTVQGSGGTTPYSYVWSSGQTTASVNDLAAGSYTVTVTDANDCTTEIQIDINEPEVIVLQEDNHTDALCQGSSDGTASVSSSGGSLPHSYQWSNGQSGPDANGLPAGTVTVTVTDDNGCTNEIAIDIAEPTDLELAETNNVAANCNSSTDGSASVAGSGGTPPYSYQWNNGQSGPTATNLAAGSYSVVITDANGCTETLSVLIDEPTVVVLVEDNHTDALCKDNNDGTASVSASGGTTPYTFDWSDGQSGAAIGGLPAGTHQVTVTDDHGCTDEISITIEEPELLQATASTNDALCNGGNEGSVSITAFGGTAPYSYDIGAGSTSNPDISGLSAGNYMVTITDDQDCTTTTNFTIDEPSALAASASSTATLCNTSTDGTATASANGGTPPYTYLWDDGQSTITANGLPTGTIGVVITDTHGCTTTASVNVDAPPAINLSISAEDALCKDDPSGSASVSASGGTPPFTYLWSDAQLSATAEFLVAGTYTVTVTDANGCTEEASTAVSDPDILVITSADVVEAVCGQPNGSVDITVEGGTQPYSYNWSNMDTDEDPTALFPGNYSVTVTDANGCTAVATYNVTEPGALNMTNATVNASCNSFNDGSIDLMVSGGNPPYSFLWNNSSILEDLTDLPAGNYIVTVTDGDGCTITESITITEPQVLSVMLTPSLASCGIDDGSISLTVLGGTQPYSYSWSNGANVEDPSNMFAGTYDVLVTDANGCTISGSATIENPNPPVLSFTSTDVNCHAGIDGTISLDISGGSGQYIIDWSDDDWDGVANPNAMSAGTYIVTVTDSDNCSATETITINEPAEPLAIQELGIVQATCGNANGSVDIDVSGGTAPYTYNWSNGTTNQDANNLTPGVISVTVTDANDCETSESFNVSEPNALQIDSAVPSDVLCNGGNDGSIAVAVIGGSMPYSYLWASGEITEDLNNLPAGDYVLTVSDNDGCTVSISVTVNEPEALSASAIPSTASCGLADGNINLIVQGGTSPYTYVWDNGAVVEDPQNLFANTYSVIVTDANGCTIAASAEVVNPNSPELSTSFTDVNCKDGNDGSIALTITGGSGIYTIDWSEDAVDGQDNPTTLTAGDYTVTVTDSENCSVTESFTISEPEALALVIDDIQEAVCGEPNGSVSVSISGGTTPYSYLWSNDEVTEDISNIFPGVYSLTVTDANGCELIQSFNVTEPNALQADGTPSAVLCNGGDDGSVNINVTGGNLPYTFLWTNGATTEDISDLMAGNYTVTITDGDGCTFTFATEVTEPDAIEITSTIVEAVCNEANGSISMVVIGGTTPYMYDWDNADDVEDPQNLFAGTYNVTVTDANGCTAVHTETVTTPNGLAVSAVETDANCNGDANGAVDASVVGGIPPYQYLWTNGATTEDITDVAAGSYTLIVTDMDGCTVSITATVDEPAALISIADQPLGALCNGSSDGGASLNTNGGTAPYTYLWSNGTTNAELSGVPAGTYSVTITDAHGCTTTESVVIDEPDLLVVNAVGTDANCHSSSDGSIDASVVGGTTSNGQYTFSWSNGADPVEDPAGLAAGIYTVIVTDDNGCTATTNVTIGQPTAIEITIADESNYNGFNLTCSDATDGFLEVAAQGGNPPYTYAWDNGATTNSVEEVTAGNYVVTVTDGSGCTEELPVSLDAPSPISVDALVVPPHCHGDKNGIISLESVSGGTAPFTYSINGGPLETFPGWTNLGGGNYEVLIQDANGCQWNTSLEVADPDPIGINLGGDIEIPLGDSLQLDPEFFNINTATMTYNWSQGIFKDSTGIGLNPQIKPVHTTVYELHIVDENGCTTTDLMTVFVRKERLVYIPNAFSPNDDGINDVFMIFAGQGVAEVKVLHIFDRWGETLFTYRNFQPNDPDFGWDGRLRGELMQPAVFVYYAEIEFEDGGVELFKGSLTLVR